MIRNALRNVLREIDSAYQNKGEYSTIYGHDANPESKVVPFSENVAADREKRAVQEKLVQAKTVDEVSKLTYNMYIASEWFSLFEGERLEHPEDYDFGWASTNYVYAMDEGKYLYGRNIEGDILADVAHKNSINCHWYLQSYMQHWKLRFIGGPSPNESRGLASIQMGCDFWKLEEYKQCVLTLISTVISAGGMIKGRNSLFSLGEVSSFEIPTRPNDFNNYTTMKDVKREKWDTIMVMGDMNGEWKELFELLDTIPERDRRARRMLSIALVIYATTNKMCMHARWDISLMSFLLDTLVNEYDFVHSKGFDWASLLDIAALIKGEGITWNFPHIFGTRVSMVNRSMKNSDYKEIIQNFTRTDGKYGLIMNHLYYTCTPVRDCVQLLTMMCEITLRVTDRVLSYSLGGVARERLSYDCRKGGRVGCIFKRIVKNWHNVATKLILYRYSFRGTTMLDNQYYVTQEDGKKVVKPTTLFENVDIIMEHSMIRKILGYQKNLDEDVDKDGVDEITFVSENKNSYNKTIKTRKPTVSGLAVEDWKPRSEIWKYLVGDEEEHELRGVFEIIEEQE